MRPQGQIEKAGFEMAGVGILPGLAGGVGGFRDVGEVFECINSTWKEHEEKLHYDMVSGEVMTKELVDATRKVEKSTFKKHGVYEKVPIEEC